MADVTTLVALVVALFALAVATLQVTQQLLATGYVVRKCDRVVVGGLTRGGVRKFHWRQLRFTVRYQVITFAFPMPLYESLGVSPAILVEASSDDLWVKASRLKATRTTTQGSWVSFVQDMLPCLRPRCLGLRWESGDRIPDDLTVAPAQVDALTVMLLSVASGLQLSKYSPATGEIGMSGRLGAVTSSIHPVLGVLLHYTPTVQTTTISSSTIPSKSFAAHSRAVAQEKGVWANAVFGKFNDRSYGRGFQHMSFLRAAKFDVLRRNGWPEDSRTDTIGGAAGFMAFATVDVYEAVPPTCVRRWSAHFSEVIVKAHLREVQGTRGRDYPQSLRDRRHNFLEKNGGSSPFLSWDQLKFPPAATAVSGTEKQLTDDDHVAVDDWHDYRAIYHSQSKLQPIELASSELADCARGRDDDKEDPSAFMTAAAAYEVIIRCDQAMHFLQGDMRQPRAVHTASDEIVAAAISSLAEAGAPSWGDAATATFVDEWPCTVTRSCDAFIANAQKDTNSWSTDVGYLSRVVAHAKLALLRAAYFTVLMRAADELGPALQEDTEPVTSLVYLA
jgi:hypothetical protein